MKVVCALFLFAAMVAYVCAQEIDPVEVEAKAQEAEASPAMPTVDGKLAPTPGKVQKRGLYGWGWGPGWGYGYGWGHPGFGGYGYGGWGPYGGYGWGGGWGGFFY